MMKMAVPPYGLSDMAYGGDIYWDWDISMGLPAAMISPRAGIGGSLSKADHLSVPTPGG